MVDLGESCRCTRVKVGHRGCLKPRDKFTWSVKIIQTIVSMVRTTLYCE
jgi:hypothetical protein